MGGCVSSRQYELVDFSHIEKSFRNSSFSGVRRPPRPQKGRLSRMKSKRMSEDIESAEEPTVDRIEQLRNDVEDAELLTQEILRRNKSAVRTEVTRFDQLDARTRFPPILKDVKAPDRNPNGLTDENVNKFEQIEAEAHRIPKKIRVESKLKDSKIYEQVLNFEEIEKEGKRVPGPSIEEIRLRRMTSTPKVPKKKLPPPPVYTL